MSAAGATAEDYGREGIELAGQGRLAEAIERFRATLRLEPGSAQAHHNLGVALAQHGRLADAARCLEEAVRLRADYPEAYANLANVLTGLKRPGEAAGCYERALALRPDHGDAYNNLGLLRTEQGRAAEAVVLLRQAVRLRPELAEAHNNLGLALAELGRYDQAEAAYHEALRLRPGYAEAHGNLANLYQAQGRFEEALACFQVALWHQPEAASIHWNRALALLQMGDYEHGWPEYEWRRRRPQAKQRSFAVLEWDGGPLGGKTILLHTEQGLGDAIQFVRYAALVAGRGGRVLVECPASWVPLLSTCPGVERAIAEGAELPPFDMHAPLLSMPFRFGTTLATVPADVPYLAAEPARVERWRAVLEREPGFRAGIVWQGNPHHVWDKHRSVPLAALAPLAGVPGVRLISLQKGPGTEQLAGARFPVEQLADDLDGREAVFLDTAAIVCCLDLVVTVDTAAAHLAGALGVPCWVALSTRSDWRWLTGRDDSPWYPTLRLFRQERLGDWGPVFARMAAELAGVVRVRPDRTAGD